MKTRGKLRNTIDTIKPFMWHTWKNIINSVYVFTGFVVVAASVAQLSSPSTGVYRGGDSSWPWSTQDAVQQLKSILSPWATHILPTGFYTTDNSGWINNALRVLLFRIFGGDPATAQRVFVILLIAFPMTSMFYLLSKFIKQRFIAVGGGILYGASYLNFNFTQMSWDNLQITYGALPLILLCAININENQNSRLREFLLLGFLSAPLASGTSISYPLFILPFFLFSQDYQKNMELGEASLQTSKSTIFFALGQLAANLFWIIPRVIWNPYIDNQGLQNLSNSGVSEGARANLWLTSWLDGRGTQFNNSYFAFLPQGKNIIGYLVVFLAFLAFKRRASLPSVVRSVRPLFLAVLFLVVVVKPYRTPYLQLIFGRDDGRISAILLLCIILLACTYIDAELFSRALQFSLILVACIGTSWPFIVGLEAPSVPPQPALTLRPIHLAEDYDLVYDYLNQFENLGASSVTFVPGAALVRITNAGERFEPSFNLAAASSFHFPLPAGWAISDKLDVTLQNSLDQRGSVLTSGDAGRIFNLMLAEDSNHLVFNLREMTDGDTLTLKAVESSRLFEEAEIYRPQKTNQFRVFKTVGPKSHLSILGPSHKNFENLNLFKVVTSKKNFLGATRSPYGYEITLCSQTAFSLPRTLETNLAWSSSWNIKLSGLNRSECSNGTDELAATRIGIQTSMSNETGHLKISTQLYESNAFEDQPVFYGLNLEATFKPAELQQTLFFLFLVAYLVTGLGTIYIVFRGNPKISDVD